MNTKTHSALVKNKIVIGLVALVLISLPGLMNAQIITIPNGDFSSGNGSIAGQLTLLGGSSAAPAQSLGTTGWYGQAGFSNAVVVVPVAGIRPGVAINNGGNSTGVAEINYVLGADLGGLAGLEMPEADVWRPITGQSLLANTTYRFSVDLNTGSLLDLNALGSRGFGIGVTGGATASSMGTFVADSISNPSFASISLIGGTTQRVTLTFTTAATPPPGGDIGVVVFAGRGTQALSLGLLTDYRFDNASLEVVPEPQTAVLAGLGLLVLLRGHRFIRTLGGNNRNSREG